MKMFTTNNHQRYKMDSDKVFIDGSWSFIYIY